MDTADRDSLHLGIMRTQRSPPSPVSTRNPHNSSWRPKFKIQSLPKSRNLYLREKPHVNSHSPLRKLNLF